MDFALMVEVIKKSGLCSVNSKHGKTEVGLFVCLFVCLCFGFEKWSLPDLSHELRSQMAPLLFVLYYCSFLPTECTDFSCEKFNHHGLCGVQNCKTQRQSNESSSSPHLWSSNWSESLHQKQVQCKTVLYINIFVCIPINPVL